MDFVALWLTLRLAIGTTAILLVVALPLAWWIASGRGVGRALVQGLGVQRITAVELEDDRGVPKGVVNTHRMLTANQQQIAQIWPFLAEQPLVLVDWLPWNHTFGGNHNFNLVLRHAGTLTIDGGRPLPHLVGETGRDDRTVAAERK